MYQIKMTITMAKLRCALLSIKFASIAIEIYSMDMCLVSKYSVLTTSVNTRLKYFIKFAQENRR